MNSPFARNLAASVLAQLLRYGAPLAFFPYLTRTLGAEDFASFALAFAVSVMLGQLIEFGFGLPAARALSEADAAPQAAARVVGDVIVGRLATLAVVASCAAALWVLVPQMRASPPTIIAISLLAAGYGFSATWYFIGREKAARIAGLEIITSFSQLLLLLLFVKDGAEPWAPVLVMAAPVIVIAAFGHWLSVRELGITLPDGTRLIQKLAESFQFFCFTGILPILNRAHLLVLSAMAAPSQVAYYAIGERIATAAANAALPIVRVAMPRITRLRVENPSGAIRLLKQCTVGLTSLALIGAITGTALAPWGIPIAFGEAMKPSALVVSIQLFTVPAMIAGQLGGTLGLVPLHEERLYQKIVLGGGFIGLLCAPLAVTLGDGVALATLRVLTEISMATAILISLMEREKTHHMNSMQT